MALVFDRIQPLNKAEEYNSVQSRAFTPKPVLAPDDLSLNLAERVELALKQEASSPDTGLKDPGKGTSSFTAVSREQLALRYRSETPPLGTYSPQFDVIQSKSPRIVFSRARFDHSFGRVETEGEGDICKKRNRSLLGVDTTPRYRGIPFVKQTDRPHFVDPRKGPNENRFFIIRDGRVVTRRAHAFAAYSPRRELFRLPTHSPDYSPKYDFLSRRRAAINRTRP